jgi:hypothetical protein
MQMVPFIREHGELIYKKDLEYTLSIQEKNMKECGEMVEEMVKV